MVWKGIAIGAVIGPDADTEANGLGGAKNANDTDSKNGGQGLFSVAGHEVWVYGGGILGVGEGAGLYGTAGLMIGASPDIGIGGGVHLFRAFGVGVIVPVFHTLAALSANPHTAALADTAYDTLETVMNVAHSAVAGGLETMMTDPVAGPLTAGVAAGAVATGKIPFQDIGRGVKNTYVRGKLAAMKALYGY